MWTSDRWKHPISVSTKPAAGQSAKAIDAIIANDNNTPRKCLGFKTPAETFRTLHFKCESTGVIICR
ncbi:hypothetical protein CDQ91_14160 [Sphingopyxis witflariensis]|uniref:Uncharacterized protein n=1 Tax=Sphingopyxis witflariensis TaxID=173675 RepID=A0A2D0AMT0_9SPHN|nr:hypothetical protein CDQ91_14160 [Sphingopyxis witflariensis]